MRILLNYPYPGNVREMENIIEHAMILCRQGAIEEHHLPDYMGTVRQSEPLEKPAAPDIAGDLDNEIKKITSILNKYNHHRGKAAQALGINRSTLWRKMKRHGLL